MKALIKPITTYEIEVDGVPLGGFKKRSIWNGMDSYQNEHMEIIIIEEDQENIFMKLIQEKDEPPNGTVIKLSQSLYNKLKREEKPFNFNTRDYKVFLDGKEIDKYIAVDSNLGEVLVYDEEALKKGIHKHKTLRGQVKIVKAENKED